MQDLQQHPLKRCLIKYKLNINVYFLFVYFHLWVVCKSHLRYSCLKKGLFTEINTLSSQKNEKTRLSDLINTVVNRALLSFNGGSLKARLTVTFYYLNHDNFL